MSNSLRLHLNSFAGVNDSAVNAAAGLFLSPSALSAPCLRRRRLRYSRPPSAAGAPVCSSNRRRCRLRDGCKLGRPPPRRRRLGDGGRHRDRNRRRRHRQRGDGEAAVGVSGGGGGGDGGRAATGEAAAAVGGGGRGVGATDHGAITGDGSTRVVGDPAISASGVRSTVQARVTPPTRRRGAAPATPRLRASALSSAASSLPLALASARRRRWRRWLLFHRRLRRWLPPPEPPPVLPPAPPPAPPPRLHRLRTRRPHHPSGLEATAPPVDIGPSDRAGGREVLSTHPHHLQDPVLARGVVARRGPPPQRRTRRPLRRARPRPRPTRRLFVRFGRPPPHGAAQRSRHRRGAGRAHVPTSRPSLCRRHRPRSRPTLGGARRSASLSGVLRGAAPRAAAAARSAAARRHRHSASRRSLPAACALALVASSPARRLRRPAAPRAAQGAGTQPDAAATPHARSADGGRRAHQRSPRLSRRHRRPQVGGEARPPRRRVPMEAQRRPRPYRPRSADDGPTHRQPPQPPACRRRRPRSKRGTAAACPMRSCSGDADATRHEPSSTARGALAPVPPPLGRAEACRATVAAASAANAPGSSRAPRQRSARRVASASGTRPPQRTASCQAPITRQRRWVSARRCSEPKSANGRQRTSTRRAARSAGAATRRAGATAPPRARRALCAVRIDSFAAAPPLSERLQRPARRRRAAHAAYATAIARSRACAAAASRGLVAACAVHTSTTRLAARSRQWATPRSSRRDRRLRHVACPLQLASARSAEWRRVDASPDASRRLRSIATRVLAAHAAHVLRRESVGLGGFVALRDPQRRSEPRRRRRRTRTRAVRDAARPPPHARARGWRARASARRRAAPPRQQRKRAVKHAARVRLAQPPRRPMPEELPRAPAVRRRRRLSAAPSAPARRRTRSGRRRGAPK